MGKTLWPNNPSSRPSNSCGVVADYFWGGWYTAACTLAPHTDDLHNDGITYSRQRACCTKCGDVTDARHHDPCPSCERADYLRDMAAKQGGEDSEED